MTVNEIKAIINNLESDCMTDVRIKVNYGDGSGYCVSDIDSYCFMNGGLVFTVNPPVKKKYE